MAEVRVDPFWSHDGSLFVFTSFATPSIGLYNTTGLNGDMKKGGAIGIANADATGVMDNAQFLVNRGNNVTSFYPSISNDSKMVVFNQSTCGAEPDTNKTSTDYGNQSCDGYDDSSTTLWVVSPTGGPTTRLDAANGTGEQRQLVAALEPGQGDVPRRDAVLGRVLVAAPVRHAGQLHDGRRGVEAAAVDRRRAHRRGHRRGSLATARSGCRRRTRARRQPQGNHVPQWVKFAVVIEG